MNRCIRGSFVQYRKTDFDLLSTVTLRPPQLPLFYSQLQTILYDSSASLGNLFIHLFNQICQGMLLATSFCFFLNILLRVKLAKPFFLLLSIEKISAAHSGKTVITTITMYLINDISCE